ncbi:2'-5' RNA ligase superfamily protein [Mumia flava]|uniref:2'-5' RNA ligase superfamily protein n=1 Tax=Mumia flava TaxID=1348852 RepID=A0A0B2B195_9ACTN|nr:2'-5' RNA ligase family protein [Mumia flava]PJJ48161.1 2'-5' RNA ligase superfamily protein [Mumia flava]
MDRLVVVSFLAEQPPGQTFAPSRWPLHVTLVPPFSVEAGTSVVADVVAETAASHRRTEVRARETAMFGRRRDVEVTVLELSDELAALHDDLVVELDALGAGVRERPHTARGFRPHVTVRGADRVAVGDTVEIGSVSLVDQRPDGRQDARRVLGTWAIG